MEFIIGSIIGGLVGFGIIRALDSRARKKEAAYARARAAHPAGKGLPRA